MGKQNLYEDNKPPLIFAGPGIPRGDTKGARLSLRPHAHRVRSRRDRVPKSCEGKNLLPIIKGEARGVRDVVFGAYKDCQRMAGAERWKIIWYPKINRFQLFDLQNDPHEINDLYNKAEHAEKLTEMKMVLAREQERFGDNKAPWVVATK